VLAGFFALAQTRRTFRKPRCPKAKMARPLFVRLPLPMSSLVQRLRPLALFGVSGCLALLVDMGVLYLCRPALGDYGGRAVSFWAAATFTWWFNRTLTFGSDAASQNTTAHSSAQLGIWAEYGAYLSSMLVGGVVNYGAYAASVHWVDAVRAQPAWGVAIGSLCGLTLNFLSARRILQRP